VSSFTQLFGFGGDDDEPASPEEPTRPTWFDPPEDELGAVVPLSLVLASSRRGVVALSHAVAYSTGVAFEFLAEARGLTGSEANRVFHEQHIFEEADPPEALLRIGFELSDGRRVSNLGGWSAHRQAISADADPTGPLLLPHAGGGGNSGGGRVTMRPGYWLWPLPPSGPCRVSCEWPFVEIALTTLEIDGDALLQAAARIRNLWQ